MANLTEGNVKSKLVSFMLPILIGNVLQQCYSLADAVIVGQVVGDEGLAAIGASQSIQFFLISILMGLGAGSEILISKYVGQKNLPMVKRTLDSLLTAVLGLALILTLTGIFISEILLKGIGTPKEILPQSVEYLKIYFIGLFGVAGYNTLSGILRSTGNSRVPLIFLIITSVVNIGLDIWFVAGLNMGVAGAGSATVIAQTISFILCLLYINVQKDFVSYQIMNLDFRWESVREGLKCGIPFAIEQGAVSLGMFFMQAAINSLGVKVMTSYVIGAKIDSFAAIPISGIGQTICIFTSQNLGAKKIERAKKGKNFCLYLAFGISLGLLFLLWGAGEYIIKLFTNDQEIICMSYDYIKILSLAYFIASYFVVLNGHIRGTGNTVLPMISTLSVFWFSRVPSAYLLKDYWGYMGVWLAIPIGWICSCIITGVYIHGKKFTSLM